MADTWRTFGGQLADTRRALLGRIFTPGSKTRHFVRDDVGILFKFNFDNAYHFLSLETFLTASSFSKRPQKGCQNISVVSLSYLIGYTK